MSDKRDYSDIGEQISNALKDAVESRDFTELNRVVTDTVNGAIDEVRRQVNNVSQAVNGQQGYEQRTADGQWTASEQRTAGTQRTAGSQANESAANSQRTANGQRASQGTANGTQSYYERYRYTQKTAGSRTTYSSQKGTSGRQVNRTSERSAGGQRTGQTAGARGTQTAGGYGSTAAGQNGLKTRENTGVVINRSGKVGGVLSVVFGGIGTGVFALAALANLLIWAFEQTVSAAIPVGVLAVLCAVSGGFIAKGCKILGRLKRAERYAKLGSKKKFLELEDIARNTGRSLKKVRADVRRMLQLGIFPEGHMDSQESCLILDDETWQQYKLTQKEWDRKQLEAKAEGGSKSAAAKNGGTRSGKQGGTGEPGRTGESGGAAQEAPEMQIVREGQAYMERLRQLNIEIPGEVISNKLYELDYLLTRIFAVLREHPEKTPQMRKFMEYYLPTTVKLVESYAEFDKAGVQGENITSAKMEIEKTMDTINQAFEKLLDDIFLNEAMETAADAQVLKTLLAQDGYTKSDFDMKG